MDLVRKGSKSYFNSILRPNFGLFITQGEGDLASHGLVYSPIFLKFLSMGTC